MGKKAIALIMLLFLSLSLAGCSVASEKEIVKYTNDRYGEATLLRTEKPDDENTICYFKDKEYCFEYYVTSYMNEILIDGSYFGSTENKGSNFDIQYYNYINEEVDYDLSILEQKYNIDISVSDGTYIYYFARVNYKSNNISNVASVTKEISDLYTAVDTRNYWKDLVVEAYDKDGNYLGSYHHGKSGWMTTEDEYDMKYIDEISNLASDAKYLRKEQHLFTETGVNIQDVVQVLGNPEVKENSLVTYYIFTIDGKEYYMCDFMVHDDIGGFEWYTTYKK